MPEGDTVWLTAHRLHQALAGQELTVADLRVPDLACVDLRGHAVREVLARGKHLLIRLESARTLHAHLKMDGSWHISPAGRRASRRPEHMIRILLGNEQWLATGYRVHDLALIDTDQEAALVGHLGPDLLGPDWDLAEALRRLCADPTREVAEALLDQRNVAGIGNLYKCEVLFVERVHPWLPVGDVAQPERLLVRARQFLLANRDHPEQSTTGLPGRERAHWVYQRGGQPCRRCSAPIAVAEQGEPLRARTTYWCPACQPSA